MCWWYQTVTAGCSPGTSRPPARDSGSENAGRPGEEGSNALPPPAQRRPKLRLRSTPRAFWRVPRRTPSGLTVSTSHSSTPAGGVERRRREITARPAVSLPWIEPTTRTFTGPSPTRAARSGWSSAEWPNTSDAAAAARASTRGTVASAIVMDSIVIVGAGTFGASLAWWLARDGVQVTLVDQFEPGDRRATSGGETRLIRCGHGGDALYTASARRARPRGRELEAESGADLLIECGLVWFARRADGWEAASEVTMRAQGIPVERLGVEEG